MRTTTTRSLLLRTMMVAVLAMAGSNVGAQSSPDSCCGQPPPSPGSPPTSQECSDYYNYCMCDCLYWTTQPFAACGGGNYGMCQSACTSQGQGYFCW